MNDLPKKFGEMSRRELIAEIKRMNRGPESEVTLQMLISAGFVSEKKVAQARKIARDLIAKQQVQD